MKQSARSIARGRHAVVTIDGPAGAGKSTVARQLAERLGFAYVNSGAIYRAVAWRASPGRARGERLADASASSSWPRPGGQRHSGRRAGRHRGALRPGGERARGDPVPAPGRAGVRRRASSDACATRGPVVVEGRDAGTVVFPEADCKFYLDASPGGARPPAIRRARGGRGAERAGRRSRPAITGAG